jgi:hypothetical protein
MLLIEEENKRVVMVYGTEGQAVPHGPFDTEDEACYYVSVISKLSGETFKRLLGYEVDHVRVQQLVYLTGMV